MANESLAIFAAMGVFAVIVSIAIYIYFAVALLTIAKKTNTPNAWLAFIPIANVYLMTQVAKLPAWWTLAVLLPLFPFIGAIAMWAVLIYIWWKIAEVLGRPGWWSLLLLIPVANLVIVGILAWGKPAAVSTR